MLHKQLILGMGLTSGYGTLPGSWRAPHVNPANYANVDANIRYAKAAERGGFSFLFLPDFAGLRGDAGRDGIQNIMEPMLELAAISQATSRIGLVATGSTTFQEPYTTARQFKALDVMSRGRAGWNAVTTSDPTVAANYGAPVADRGERYQRAHEVVQIVQSLWGSWERDAWVLDKDTGQYLNPAKVRPINLSGQHVASRGPLPIPPSAQGQPVIFTAGGSSPHLLQLAGRYADGFIAEVWTVEEARAQRDMVREAAREAGRNPDDIKYFTGLMPTVAPSVREGLDRRLALSEELLKSRVHILGSMLGVHLSPALWSEPIPVDLLDTARAHPGDPRSGIALSVARQGWSVRDILAHGVIDYHPVTVGPGEVHADHMQQWFEAGATDGFWLLPDVYEDGVDAFVDEVVPLLRARGIYSQSYVGSTLRENLGVPDRYGPDPRVI